MKWFRTTSSKGPLGEGESTGPINLCWVIFMSLAPEMFNSFTSAFCCYMLTSFESLRTVDNTVCESFKATCLAHGLIRDDKEYERTLHETLHYSKPYHGRHVFCYILIFCEEE